MSERVRISGGFTAIPNTLLRSSAIGLEHKGMLGLIASHANDWDFRQADMLRKSKCSKDKYYRIINDLKALGYLEIVPRDKVNGRYSGSDWVLHFSPSPENQDTAPRPENQDQPRPEKPDTEIQDDKNNNNKNTKRITTLTRLRGGDSVDEVISVLDLANLNCSNAAVFHDDVEHALISDGFEVQREFEVSDRGDGRKGRVDLVARKGGGDWIGIECDRAAARAKSIKKLQQFRFGIVALRESDGGEDSISGIRVSHCGVRTDVPSGPVFGSTVSKEEFMAHVEGRSK